MSTPSTESSAEIPKIKVSSYQPPANSNNLAIPAIVIIAIAFAGWPFLISAVFGATEMPILYVGLGTLAGIGGSFLWSKWQSHEPPAAFVLVTFFSVIGSLVIGSLYAPSQFVTIASGVILSGFAWLTTKIN